jgi:hypothetical protein
MIPKFCKISEDSKVLIISLSSFCINNCEGCTYSKKERDDLFLMPLDKFEKIIKNFSYYCKESNNLIPHFLLGTGEIFNFDLEEYFNIILKYNTKVTIELATTGKIENFNEKLQFLIKKFKNTEVKIIIEFVFDILKNNEKELELIKNSYQLAIKSNFEIHNILKVSLLYKNMTNQIIKNLKFIGVNLITLDYLFLDTSKIFKLMNLKEYIEYFKEVRILLNKENIKIIDFLMDYSDINIKTFENFNYSYYITKDYDLYYNIELPFGEFIVTPLNSNYDKILNNESINETTFLNKLKTKEKVNYNQNIYNAENNEICNSCDYKYICSSKFIKDISEYNNIEFSKEYCLGVKNLLNLSKEVE